MPQKRKKVAPKTEPSGEKQHKIKKYVFSNSDDISAYISVLQETAGPVHSTMALLRSALAARTYQIQNLKRKHVILGAHSSQVYLLPMKGYEGEWAELPKHLHEWFKRASKAGGIVCSVKRDCGNRPATEAKVAFSIKGGDSGMGDPAHQEDYIFRPEFSGRANVSELHWIVLLIFKAFNFQLFC